MIPRRLGDRDGLADALEIPGGGSAGRERARSVVRIAERELAEGISSASETRRWLRALAKAFGLGELVADNLVLIASEMLANAILHAVGPYSVLVEIESEVVRIGVRDGSSTLPVLKEFEEDAPTGRGLRIIAAAGVDWGVDAYPGGKLVWADVALPGLVETAREAAALGIGPGERAGRGEGRASNRPQPAGGRSRSASTWAPTGRDGQSRATSARTGNHPSEADPAIKRVTYRSVPVTDFVAMRARIEAFLREGALIVLGGARPDVPPELSEVAELATTRFAGVVRAEAGASPAPVSTDGELGDFVVDFPVGAASQLDGYSDAVQALNGWGRSEDLLVSPLTPVMLALHKWAIAEAKRQIAGEAPRGFPA